MGSSIEALIEYDCTLWDDPGATTIAPFSTVPEAIDLTDFTLFRAGRDYRFLGAISGIRNPTDRPPLVQPRGLPTPMNGQAARRLDELFDPDYSGLGWLTRAELDASIAHLGFTRDDLSLETNVVLRMMDYLEERLGQDRVRLVFGVE